WPKWLQDFYTMAVALTWGNDWVVLLKTFIAFQRHHNFGIRHSESLPPAPHRPAIIGNWKNNAKSWSHGRSPWNAMATNAYPFDATISNWWTWWKNLQPDGRSEGVTYLPPEGDDLSQLDWAPLARAGSNGFIEVMVVLVWWGLHGRRLGKDLSDMSAAVKDVRRVILAM
ncbi:hypothetical protein OE88DRAFT_1613105, partial [Heliocybe sulcata]